MGLLGFPSACALSSPANLSAVEEEVEEEESPNSAPAQKALPSVAPVMTMALMVNLG